MAKDDTPRRRQRLPATTETPTGPLALPEELRSADREEDRQASEELAAPIVRVLLEGTGYRFMITEPGEHLLGRAEDAALRVTSPMVSRKQARIVLSDDRLSVTIEDLGAANVTMLNGRPVAKALLFDGDELALGDLRLGVGVDRGTEG